MGAATTARAVSPGQLVILRHGQSEWNLANLFTGWMDVDLSEKGIVEAREAGKLLNNEGVSFDVVYTSSLRRAIRTACLVLSSVDQCWVPMHKLAALNEQHSGALTGFNKRALAEAEGVQTVMRWRRGFDCPPPPLPRNSTLSQRIDDLRYNPIGEAPLPVPVTESFAACRERVDAEWRRSMLPSLLRGENVLVVAHGNTLRALVMTLDNLTPSQISSVDLPTAAPLVYDFEWAETAAPELAISAGEADISSTEVPISADELAISAAPPPSATPPALRPSAVHPALRPSAVHGTWGDSEATRRHGRFLVAYERVRQAQRAMREQVLLRASLRAAP